ncbi:hypothetical protein J0H58_35735 [bacterium]|nr:hypothetical protein [bacterium]
MALSRLAKKFREQEPTPTTTPVVSKKAGKAAKKVAKPASVAPVVVAPVPAPPPEPVPPPEPPKPGKRAQEKVKRPKFVYVPQKSERKPVVTPAPLPQRSNKLAAKMMTQNLSLPPEEEAGRGPTLPGFGRI